MNLIVPLSTSISDGNHPDTGAGTSSAVEVSCLSHPGFLSVGGGEMLITFQRFLYSYIELFVDFFITRVILYIDHFNSTTIEAGPHISIFCMQHSNPEFCCA